MTKAELAEENSKLRITIVNLENDCLAAKRRIADLEQKLEKSDRWFTCSRCAMHEPMEVLPEPEEFPVAAEFFVNCPKVHCTCAAAGYTVPNSTCAQKMLPQDPVEKIQKTNEKAWHDLQNPLREAIENAKPTTSFGCAPKPKPETPITWESLIRLVDIMAVTSEDDFDALSLEGKVNLVKHMFLCAMGK